MSSINANQSSMVALETLRGINKNLNQVQNQISTGKKISNARDNSAIWAVSKVMETDVASFKSIKDSLNLGAATVGVARSASEQVTGLLQQMKEQIVASQEENVDRSKIQTNVAALRDQIGSIVDAAQFNGLNLLKGGGSVDVLSSLNRSSDGSVTVANISTDKVDLGITAQAFGAGTGAETVTNPGAAIADNGTGAVTITADTIVEGASFRITFSGSDYEYVARDGDTLNNVSAGLAAAVNADTGSNVTAVASDVTDPTATDSTITLTNNTGAALTVTSANASAGTAGGGLAGLAAIDVSTDAGAETALNSIEGLLQTAINASADFGSSQTRIDIQNEFVTSLVDSMKLGISALTDTDMEEASARLQALQVQQQLGVQALSIANQGPQALLSLFR